MTEAEKIESLRRNGGRHLQKYKEENITYAMCQLAVKLDGTAFYFVPKQFRTEEICKLACKTCGSALQAVPQEFISKEICEYAVSSDGLAIEYVPEKFKTRDMFLLAAGNNPSVMKKMPVEYLDAEFCISVVKKCGNNAISSLPNTHKNGNFYILLIEKRPDLLWDIPKSCHTSVICKTAIKAMGYKSTADAVKDNPSLLSQLHTSLYDHDTCYAFVSSEFFYKAVQGNSHGYNTKADKEKGLLFLQKKFEDHYSLTHILRWEDVCLIVADILPEAIRYISSKVITYEMCLIAVKRSHWAFSFVPDRFKSKEICMLAFEKEPSHLKEFTKELITYDLCLEAVKRDHFSLDAIPRELITYELCMEAVKCSGYALAYVPEEYFDEDLCLTGLQNPDKPSLFMLKDIPEKARTYAVCLQAVLVDSGSFKYVPEEHKTYELCLASAQRGNLYMEDLPEEFYTEELCLALVRKNPHYFNTIPKNKLTEKVCLLGISKGSAHDGTVLSEIPRELITQEMCDKAVNISWWSFAAVPEEFVTEEMLMNVAEKVPERLADSFPERYRNESFCNKLIELYPYAERYVRQLLK